MLRKYKYHRKLPHYQRDNESYFITFSTHQRWILPEPARSIVIESCLHANGKRFLLHGVVVMPDHVHLLLTPLVDDNGPVSLPEIMQGIKSASAHRINRTLGRTGKVWQDESFDRALRCEESLEYRMEYMMGNPVRAGIVQNPLDYGWLWRDTGESTSVA